MQTLVDLQAEYQDWPDQASALAEKPGAICQHAFGDPESPEPPFGCGRD